LKGVVVVVTTTTTVVVATTTTTTTIIIITTTIIITMSSPWQREILQLNYIHIFFYLDMTQTTRILFVNSYAIYSF
jgi:hypothetical protein